MTSFKIISNYQPKQIERHVNLSIGSRQGSLFRLIFGSLIFPITQIGAQGGFQSPTVESFSTASITEDFSMGDKIGQFNVSFLGENGECDLVGNLTDISVLNSNFFVNSMGSLINKIGNYTYSYSCINNFEIPSNILFGVLEVIDTDHAPSLLSGPIQNLTDYTQQGKEIGVLTACDSDSDMQLINTLFMPEWLSIIQKNSTDFCSNFSIIFNRNLSEISTGIYNFSVSAQDDKGFVSNDLDLSTYYTASIKDNSDDFENKDNLLLVIFPIALLILCSFSLGIYYNCFSNILRKSQDADPEVVGQNDDKKVIKSTLNKISLVLEPLPNLTTHFGTRVFGLVSPGVCKSYEESSPNLKDSVTEFNSTEKAQTFDAYLNVIKMLTEWMCDQRITSHTFGVYPFYSLGPITNSVANLMDSISTCLLRFKSISLDQTALQRTDKLWNNLNSEFLAFPEENKKNIAFISLKGLIQTVALIIQNNRDSLA
jgi:hypothetical protein